jgi:hypothetical protein
MEMKQIHQQYKECGTRVGVVQKSEKVEQGEEGQGHCCHQGHLTTILEKQNTYMT